MDTVTKQASEIFPIGASIYSSAPTEKVVLATSVVTAIDKNGSDVSATFLDQTTLELVSDPAGGTDNALQIKVRAGGANLSPYKVTFAMDTDDSNHFEVDVLVVVKEE